MSLATILAFGAFDSSFAKDNAKKGKFLYKKNCRVACHTGETKGVKELNPTSKTQKQWERYFIEENSKLLEEHPKGELDEVLEKFEGQDYKDVLKYLKDHAADSDQPQTCG
ncbi:MAG: cytochrome c [Calditrichaeota bacterium]|nr:MAG: cytochrome c [Calditrichota bacterium]